MHDELPAALRRTTPMTSANSVTPSNDSETKPIPKRKPYRVIGNDIQFVEIDLKPQMGIVGEISALMHYDDGIDVKVSMIEGEQQRQGLLTRLLGVGKRVMRGGELFSTTFINHSDEVLTIAFAAQYPGTIVPVSLKETHGKLFCLKSAFLCAARNTQISSASQRELGGSFSYSGVTMQKLEGNGLVFIHAGGSVEEITLDESQVIHVSVGAAMAIESTVTIRPHKIRHVGLVGEGHDLLALTGPGRVWLQSLPFPVVRRNIALYTQNMLKDAKKRRD